LKRSSGLTTISMVSCVAPRAGAWVETFPIVAAHQKAEVAPRAGAWVETLNVKSYIASE